MTAEGGHVGVVELPADIRTALVDAGRLVSAAWAPGVRLLVADLAWVQRWDAPAVESLLGAHRDLASRGAELRLVVWSRDLHAAVQRSSSSPKPSVYTSVDAALHQPGPR
jgi:anti-anti-sigma regulatory factor